MKKDYYKSLGVTEKASSDEIRRAFRRLAQQHHPDKGGDEAKFKEINEAYQVLSDPQKRQQYDQFGSSFDGFNGGQAPGWQDFSQGFGGQGFGGNGGDFGYQDLGDMVGDLFGFGRRGGRQDTGKGRDMEIEISVGFREAIFGVEKEFEINRTGTCETCSGKGAEPGSKMITCPTCEGRGQVRYNQNIIFGTIQTVRPCVECLGSGKKPEKPCRACRGSGTTEARKKLRIKIPAGIDNGESIRLVGQGEAGKRAATSGDLYVHIRVASDKEIRREGTTLYSRQEILFPLAAIGGVVPINTVDGKVDLRIPAGTQPGQVFKLKNHGVPSTRGHARGDHLVEISVKVPDRLSSREKEIIKQLGDEMGVSF